MSTEREAYMAGFKAGYDKGRADEKLEAAEQAANFTICGDLEDICSDPWTVYLHNEFDTEQAIAISEGAADEFDMQSAMNSLWQQVKDSDQRFVLESFEGEARYPTCKPEPFSLIGSDIMTLYDNRKSTYTFWMKDNPEKTYTCAAQVYERLWDNRNSSEVLDVVRTRIEEMG